MQNKCSQGEITTGLTGSVMQMRQIKSFGTSSGRNRTGPVTLEESSHECRLLVLPFSEGIALTKANPDEIVCILVRSYLLQRSG